MNEFELTVTAPADFNFWRTVLSHGWSSLPPFHLNLDSRRLLRVLSTSCQTVLMEMEEVDGQLGILIRSHGSMTQAELDHVRSQFELMFRWHEPLQPFFAAIRKSKGNKVFAWIPRVKAGRLLRGPNLFEDVIKMLCTTNCTWSATQRMIGNLVCKLGKSFSQGFADFPSPAKLASTTETFLIEEIRSGYRSPYILQFAESVASGRLDLNLWEHLDSKTLYQELMSIKGIGPYAAGNLMRLLGHYEHLALDSWCRQMFSNLHKKGRKVSDQAIFNHYRHHGQWKGLVMWLDLTNDWFDKAR
jgi:3-methyladenine DNA glycosylase/8-oxoguanine DNA glycosylase